MVVIRHVFLGIKRGKFNATGSDNTFVGNYAGQENTTGSHNTFLGHSAGVSNETGKFNTYIGRSAGAEAEIGNNNTFVGMQSGQNCVDGSNNVLIGKGAGVQLVSGIGNVFIGHKSGFNELGSDKLYIENSDSPSPLIYGEFDNDLLRINGQLVVTGGFTDLDNDTRIQVEEGPDDDVIRFDIEGTEVFKVSRNPAGYTLIDLPNSGGNGSLSFGSGAGSLSTTGNSNTFVGNTAGSSNNTGSSNAFFGFKAGENIISGSRNTYIGRSAGRLGNSASDNIFVGMLAGESCTDGSQNVILGKSAGGQLVNGFGNVFIGHRSGFNELGSDKLYIENSDSPSPLIYGEFDNDLLRINGQLVVTGGFADLDNDTRIQVEEGPDDDVIRFDIEGIEVFKVSRNPAGYTLIDLPNSGGNGSLSFGSGAGSLSTTGNSNVFVGYAAGSSNTTGSSNAFFGREAGENNISGSRNTYVGRGAGSMANNASDNIFVGMLAGESCTDGSQNVFLGKSAGGQLVSGFGNVFIGHNSGFNELGSDKLYIENSDSPSPLIYGEFDNDLVEINGKLGVEAVLDNGTLLTLNNLGTSNANALHISSGSTGSTNIVRVQDDAFVIQGNGRIGIGTLSPSNGLVEISGSADATFNYGYLNSSGSTGTGSGQGAYSLYASNRIAAVEFNAHSDEAHQACQGRVRQRSGPANPDGDRNHRLYIDRFARKGREVLQEGRCSTSGAGLSTGGHLGYY